MSIERVQPDEVTCLATADTLLLLTEMLGAPTGWPEPGAIPTHDQIDELAVAGGLERVEGAVQALHTAVAAWSGADRELARVEHCALFDGPLACPPNETIFIRRDKGALLADISGFYLAFGFTLAEDFGEKQDHLLAELQFVALLHVLMARALEAGDAAQLEIVRDALRAFLCDHLGLWVGPFAARLEHTAQSPLYNSAAVLLAACWKLLELNEGIEPGELDPADGPLAAESGTPYECGMCADDPA